MRDQDKTKEALIKELEQLRQRISFLEAILSEKNISSRQTCDSSSPDAHGKEAWSLPGYWH